MPGSNAPHYDGEAQRRPTFQQFVASGRLPPGLGIDDRAAAIYDGSALVEIVASVAGPTAYRVEPDGRGGVRETALPARVLG